MDDLGLFKIGFVGAGKMATAIAKGVIAKGQPAANVSAYDVSAAALAHFGETSGATGPLAHSPVEALKDADIMVLAVKPQNAREALAECGPFLKRKLLISIMAGVSIAKVVEMAGGTPRVVRVMPNIAALVGAGASAFAVSAEVNDDDRRLVKMLLEAVGEASEVKESMLDAVTGLSGSGPAFVFEFVQSMAFGGVWAGLPRDIALKLAIQTVVGSALMLHETKEHPAALKDQVTSPAGTTAAGLAVLEKAAFSGAVAEAVFKAAERSRELGKSI